jgi:diguanylate cyclase (GGDEF)-like protein
VIKNKARTNGHTTEKAGIDDLTGLWNRAGFVAAATPMFQSCQRREAPIALAYFDFHSNDPSGSVAEGPAVDQVLLAMAQLMRKAFRTSDVIGRLAQLRIAVLLPDCTEEALAAVDGVRALSAATDAPDALALTAGMVRSAPGANLDDLMRAADVHARDLRGAR